MIEQRLIYPDSEAEEPPKSDGEIKFREVGYFVMPPSLTLNVHEKVFPVPRNPANAVNLNTR
jgi:hypothetical protein